MKRIKQKILILTASMLLIFNLVPAMAAADTKSDIQCGVNNASGKDCDASATPIRDANNIIDRIINLLSVIVGIVAVIMIVIAGYRYITSGGAAEKVTSAKNTLLYAVIGLVIVALAQVIARFVLDTTTKK